MRFFCFVKDHMVEIYVRWERIPIFPKFFGLKMLLMSKYYSELIFKAMFSKTAALLFSKFEFSLQCLICISYW